MENKNLEHKRHSLAHLLGAAVVELYPKSKLTLGPAVENGFYYDIDVPEKITEEYLKLIEKKMRSLLDTWKSFDKKVVTEAEAKSIFKDNEYKNELIDEIVKKGEEITLYTSGSFIDLCRGGHVENPSRDIKQGSWKLSRIAGAYWRGDEKNKMLTRIYGLAFDTKEELEAYEKQIEEAKARDHKKLGKELELFTFSPLVGSGLPLFMPKGMSLRTAILDFITALKKENNYKFVWTPHLAKEDLYVTSGHMGKYDAMLPSIVTDDGEHFVMKPMNCPHHFQIYKATPHSYRDLPLRIAENATDYRNEKSGELNGLFRVRSLTQDDTHHFVRHEQIPAEIDMILSITRKVYDIFGFKNFRARISVRDKNNKDKYFGTDELWDTAEKALIAAVERWGVPYFIGEGEAAFYGPKIDILVSDALGREWQLTTVQLDYIQPENFDMTYTDQTGKDARPAVLHAAILGSLDRFMGIIIEHYAGAFPFWLSPVQIKVLPIGEGHQEYSKNIFEQLKAADIRAEIDLSGESLGKKVRQAKIDNIPYWLIIGDKDIAANAATLESRDMGNQGQLKSEELLERFKLEIINKK